MKIVIFFSSGVASKLHKAKRQEVEDSLIEVLKHAPHMPGGPTYKVIICIYIYTTSEKPVNDQSYGVLDHYGITILYKLNKL